ncbi:hypothetical protein LO763_03280 [Glycomyces sp. A-F 0318]|uniref:hypothetical protein n=1 Tax=Glycomyces amatae TaxID=2881355 RepID=UPI001E43DC35|nr:hypothetical protein [Glycomyces amatae]MCD0442646.1 hypothetical protein [Glycomyces amatae]
MELIPFVVAPLGALTCVGAVVAVVVVAVHHTRQARRRQMAAYHHWAVRHGFHYWPEEPSALAISAQAPLAGGHGRQALDVFRGKYKGAHLHCFELRYQTGSGDSQSTHYFQVVAISLPATRPLLDIGHENFLSKRFDKDIEFENQAFNDRFKILSPSPRYAYDVIHARTMEWMLTDWRAWSYHWRFEGPWLMTFRSGRLNLNEVFFYADFLHEVLDRVPDHVWKD